MQLMSKKDVCQQLKISARTVENWVNENRFPPPVAIGRSVYWAEDAVNSWQAQTFKAQLEWKRK